MAMQPKTVSMCVAAENQVFSHEPGLKCHYHFLHVQRQGRPTLACKRSASLGRALSSLSSRHGAGGLRSSRPAFCRSSRRSDGTTQCHVCTESHEQCTLPASVEMSRSPASKRIHNVCQRWTRLESACKLEPLRICSSAAWQAASSSPRQRPQDWSVQAKAAAFSRAGCIDWFGWIPFFLAAEFCAAGHQTALGWANVQLRVQRPSRNGLAGLSEYTAPGRTS